MHMVACRCGRLCPAVREEASLSLRGASLFYVACDQYVVWTYLRHDVMSRVPRRQTRLGTHTTKKMAPTPKS